MAKRKLAKENNCKQSKIKDEQINTTNDTQLEETNIEETTIDINELLKLHDNDIEDDILENYDGRYMMSDEEKERVLRIKTDFEAKIDDFYNLYTNNQLEPDRKYDAKIVSVDFNVRFKNDFTIVYEVYDDVSTDIKYGYDCYHIWGKYGDSYLKSLTLFLFINKIYDYDIEEYKTPEELANSLQFLVGAKATLTTRKTPSGEVKFYSRLYGDYKRRNDEEEIESNPQTRGVEIF